MSYFYYKVLDNNGVQICTCGSEADARMMMNLGYNRSWIKCQFLPPDTIHTTAQEIETLELPEGLQQPFVP